MNKLEMLKVFENKMNEKLNENGYFAIELNYNGTIQYLGARPVFTKNNGMIDLPSEERFIYRFTNKETALKILKMFLNRQVYCDIKII